ncbi:MAG: hypothetical protein ACLSH0_05910 [Mediterraneibacter faecis]
MSEKGGEKIDQRKKTLTQTEIKKSLVKQLKLRGMNAEFYKDLVDDYVYYWSLKKKLIADIRKKEESDMRPSMGMASA